MDWYAPLRKKQLHVAGKPPSYIFERISDLNYACDVAKTSPCDANQVISQVITQLEKHHDDDFVPSLKEASRIMLDSPNRASEAIQKVVSAMMAEKEIMESAETEYSWNKRRT